MVPFDILGIAANFLWIIGLALILAAASHACYRARLAGGSMRRSLGGLTFTRDASWGLMLFALGLSLAGARRWWESLLWLGLAVAFGVQAWQAQRRLAGQNGDLWPLARAYFQRERLAAAGIIALALLLALLYALIIRPWMQPDEPRHFEIVQHVGRLGKLSVGFDDRRADWEQAIIADMEAQDFWWYGFSMIGWDPDNLPQSFNEIWGDYFATLFSQQPLFYSIAGMVYRAWADDLSLSQAVVVMRLFNILLYAGMLAGMWALLQALLPARPRLSLAVLAFVALWPSHLTIAASVTNDIFVELVVVWLLYALARTLREGPSPALLAAAVLLAVLAVLSKRTGLGAVAALPLALLLWAAAHLGRRRSWRVWAGVAGLIAAAGGAGFLLWRVAMTSGKLYRITPQRLAQLADPALWQQAPWDQYGEVLLHSFVGWFGWLRVLLPPTFYAAGVGLLGLAVVGWGVSLFRRERTPLAGWQRRGFLLLAAVFAGQIVLVLGRELIWQFWTRGVIPQARYLYPALPALALLLVWGWRGLLPRRWRAPALIAGLLGLVGYNLYLLFFLLYPFYWL